MTLQEWGEKLGLTVPDAHGGQDVELEDGRLRVVKRRDKAGRPVVRGCTCYVKRGGELVLTFLGGKVQEGG